MTLTSLRKSVPHRRRHTRRHYWAPPSCSWRERELVRNQESRARGHARRRCTHLFSLWPLLWKHPCFREWQMQAARQKKKRTTPKVLRKIPSMSTSSATEGGIYFTWSSRTRVDCIGVLLHRDLKFSEANQQSLQAWWLILELACSRQAARIAADSAVWAKPRILFLYVRSQTRPQETLTQTFGHSQTSIIWGWHCACPASFLAWQ